VSAPLLAFDQVTLRRGGRLLFAGLDLSLRAGEAMHLTGPNGCGKSSLIRLAAGLLRADRGTVRNSPLSLASDTLALDAELPLRRALLFWARMGGSEAKLDGALGKLGLASLADVPVRLLSTGQAKRAALARVVASGAPLWLLDEPVNGLDDEGVVRLCGLIAEHRSGGGAVLAASHVPLAGDWSRLRLGE
jgi:heme exporter protein A